MPQYFEIKSRTHGNEPREKATPHVTWVYLCENPHGYTRYLLKRHTQLNKTAAESCRFGLVCMTFQCKPGVQELNKFWLKLKPEIVSKPTKVLPNSLQHRISIGAGFMHINI